MIRSPRKLWSVVVTADFDRSFHFNIALALRINCFFPFRYLFPVYIFLSIKACWGGGCLPDSDIVQLAKTKVSAVLLFLQTF